MKEDDMNSIDKRLAKVVPKLFDKLMRDLEDEPLLVIEAEAPGESDEKAAKDMMTWLFKGR